MDAKTMRIERRTSPIRIVAAFFVAPSVIAAASASWLAFERRDWFDLFSSFGAVALMAYAMTVLSLLPIFLILWRLNRASFLAIVTSGALSAMVVCLILSLALPLRHPLHLRSPTDASYTDDSLEGAFLGAGQCGLFGLSIGAAFWVIAFSRVHIRVDG
jgi:hypothetical protein